AREMLCAARRALTFGAAFRDVGRAPATRAETVPAVPVEQPARLAGDGEVAVMEPLRGVPQRRVGAEIGERRACGFRRGGGVDGEDGAVSLKAEKDDRGVGAEFAPGAVLKDHERLSRR